MVLGSIVPANAAEPESSQIAAVIQDVAPDQGTVVSGQSDGNVVAFNDGKSMIQVPVDSSKPITVRGQTDGEPQAFEAHLPKEIGVGDGSVAPDGTIVYGNEIGAVDAAVQVLDNGSVRVQTILQNATAPDSYTYTFGDQSTLAVGPEGEIAVLNTDGSFAMIGDAWARDAKGNEVASHYEVRGNDLIQHIDISADTQFPVVADPNWAWFNAAYGVKWNRSETKQIKDSGSIFGACGFILKRAAALGAVCGLYGIYLVNQARVAYDDGWCVFTAVAPGPVVMRYKDSVCR